MHVYDFWRFYTFFAVKYTLVYTHLTIHIVQFQLIQDTSRQHLG